MDEIYCINLDQAIERKERIINRIKYHGLSEKFQFVKAFDKYSNEVNNVLMNFDLYPITDIVRGEAACLLSHINALRCFLKSENQFGIICEDDIMLHNQFIDLYNKVINNCQNESNLVLLGYIILNWDEFKWGGKNPNEKNLRWIIPEITWGTTCYRISRSYALDVLNEFDKPFSELQKKYNFITSELIIKKSNGYVSYPPLVIEETTKSYIRTEQQLDIHVAAFNMWGYFNYSLAESEHKSLIFKEYEKQLIKIRTNFLNKKKLLWISRLGYNCSYSYVSMSLLKEINKIYDTYVFCTGIVHSDEKHNEISTQLGIKKDKIFVISEKLLNSNCPEDHEYFNNYFCGMYHLSDIINKTRPDLIVSLDDNISMYRQWKIISNTKYDWNFEFIPYFSIDCANFGENFIYPKVKNIITTTNFGKRELSSIFPIGNIHVLPHIVDENTFYPINERIKLRQKWLNIGNDSIFVIGAINANNSRKRWDILLHSFGYFASMHTDVFLLIKIPYSSPKKLFGLSLCEEYDFASLINEILLKYNLDKSIIKLIEGNISDLDLNELYNCCDVGLTTTSGEGWGLIPCEMSLCKIPQIIPKWSSFLEIFPESNGFIEVKKLPVFIGRYLNKLPENFYHEFVPIVKSYQFHESENKYLDIIMVTEEIPTVCISPNGMDEGLGNLLYPFAKSMNIIAHFKTISYTITFLQKYEYSERFQIILGLDYDFLNLEFSFLVDLYKMLPINERINYVLSLNVLKKYSDCSSGTVSVPMVKDTILILEKFYNNKNLCLTEGEYCYNRIKKICNTNEIIQKFDNILKKIITY